MTIFETCAWWVVTICACIVMLANLQAAKEMYILEEGGKGRFFFWLSAASFLWILFGV